MKMWPKLLSWLSKIMNEYKTICIWKWIRLQNRSAKYLWSGTHQIVYSWFQNLWLLFSNFHIAVQIFEAPGNRVVWLCYRREVRKSLLLLVGFLQNPAIQNVIIFKSRLFETTRSRHKLFGKRNDEFNLQSQQSRYMISMLNKILLQCSCTYFGILENYNSNNSTIWIH